MFTAKSKGYSYDLKEYEFGSYVCSENILEKWDRHFIIYFFRGKHGTVEVEKDSVAHFANILDKNGRELYFGDIIKLPSGLEVEVVWVDCRVMFKADELYDVFAFGQNTAELSTFVREKYEVRK